MGVVKLLISMEAAPRFVLPPRPSPPDAGTDEHDRWCRDLTITYDGGTLTSAYGNIVQTWAPGDLPNAIKPKEINRASYEAKRQNKIGGDIKTVKVPAGTYKKYPSMNGSQAAGGELFTFDTRDGIFSARVTGDIQALVAHIAGSRMQQFQEFTVYSGSGAIYGPFTPVVLIG